MGMIMGWQDILRRDLIIDVREHPRLRGRIQRAAAAGDLRRVVPGIWSLPDAAEHPRTRMLAICRYDPDAVVIGEAASALTYRRTEPDAGPVLVARRGADFPGIRCVMTVVPAEHVLRSGDLRLSAPTWTALDLALRRGSGALDEALRCGVALESLLDGLAQFRGRRGARLLRRWLDESHQRPWSPAERAAHAAFADAGIHGWIGNLRVPLPERVVFLDIGLPRLRLGIEVDGHEYHSVRSAFVHDRLRDAELAAHGWQIVRFPAALVLHEPGRFVALARAAIDQRRALM